MIYNALILPHLNYAILAWGYRPGQLIKLQKKAVRNIVNAKLISHYSPIFKNLNLLMIRDIHTIQQIKFVHKLIHNNLPKYFDSFSIVIHCDIHNHYTININRILSTLIKQEFSKRCIRYRIRQVINNLPQNIESKLHTHSLKSLSSHVKTLKEIGTIKRFYSVYDVYYGLLHFINSTISYYKMRLYTRKTELEASTCQFPRKLRS